MIITLKPQLWARTSWTKSYFDVNVPEISNLDKPVIVLKTQNGYSGPTAYLRPFLPKAWRFVEIDTIGSDKYWDLFLKKIPSLENYQWFMLFSGPPKVELFERFGKQAPEPCYTITAKRGKYFLCKILPIRYLH